MDELEDSEFTLTSEIENFCFCTVLSRQHNNTSDTEVENQKMMA
jgi:hypothetical protein